MTVGKHISTTHSPILPYNYSKESFISINQYKQNNRVIFWRFADRASQYIYLSI